MRIYVRMNGVGDHQALDVEATETIGSLKAMIQGLSSSNDEEMEQRMLVIDGRDFVREAKCPSTLEDGKDLFDCPSLTLDECGVKDEVILRLGYKGPFLIDIGLPCYKIEVSCSDTIHSIKRKVLDITGLPVMEGNFPQVFLSAGDRTLLSLGIFKVSQVVSNSISQHTIFRNRDNQAPPSNHSLSTNLSADDEDASHKLEIVVDFPNMPWRFPLMCKLTDTIGTVRECIIDEYDLYDELFGQTYIEEGLFVLVFGKRRLEDDSITLEQCGITHMDYIQVFEDKSFPIIVLAHEHIGVQTTVTMKCLDTVGMLKEKLQDLIGIPKEKQHLFNKDLYLDDEEKRLVEYGIVMPVKYDGNIEIKTHKNSPFWDRPNEQFIIHLASSDEPELEDISSSLPPATSPEADHCSAKKIKYSQFHLGQ